MGRLRLYFVVTVSGASVLALEILGTRILGPFYGVSLFLWSALITVTLAALSVGYALGGRLADRGPTAGTLRSVLGAAGLWVLLIPLLRTPVLAATEDIGLRAAVLLTATLLFAPPLLLLGIVSPYAVRMRASALENVGRTAGDLYALSTVASVASALLMGFVLIPAVGVTRLTYAIGVLLLATAVIAGSGRRGVAVGVLLAIVAAFGGLSALPAGSAGAAPGLVDLVHSPYGEIRVIDQRGARHLLIDGSLHAIVDPETWRSWHSYNGALDVLRHLEPEPANLLLVGLGGGCLAKRFTGLGWDVTAVEIDPAVGRIAADHFGLAPEDARVVYEDGRRFLRQDPTVWRVIILDAFGSSSVPFHLITQEAFGLAASRLHPEGVLAINIETGSWDDPVVAALGASLRPHFDHVYALPTSEPPDELGNVIMLASRRPMEFDEQVRLRRPSTVLDQPHEHFWTLALNHAWDNRFDPPHGAEPLTDDRNPVDLWSEAINRRARGVLHKYFADSGGGW